MKIRSKRLEEVLPITKKEVLKLINDNILSITNTVNLYVRLVRVNDAPHFIIHADRGTATAEISESTIRITWNNGLNHKYSNSGTDHPDGSIDTFKCGIATFPVLTTDEILDSALRTDSHVINYFIDGVNLVIAIEAFNHEGAEMIPSHMNFHFATVV